MADVRPIRGCGEGDRVLATKDLTFARHGTVRRDHRQPCWRVSRSTVDSVRPGLLTAPTGHGEVSTGNISAPCASNFPGRLHCGRRAMTQSLN
jgi:hypothetical protein